MSGKEKHIVEIGNTRSEKFEHLPLTEQNRESYLRMIQSIDTMRNEVLNSTSHNAIYNAKVGDYFEININIAMAALFLNKQYNLDSEISYKKLRLKSIRLQIVSIENIKGQKRFNLRLAQWLNNAWSNSGIGSWYNGMFHINSMEFNIQFFTNKLDPIDLNIYISGGLIYNTITNYYEGTLNVSNRNPLMYEELSWNSFLNGIDNLWGAIQAVGNGIESVGTGIENGFNGGSSEAACENSSYSYTAACDIGYVLGNVSGLS